VIEPIWLTVEDILGMHNMHLGEFGGPVGIRDKNGVEAAAMRPRHRWHYANVTDVFQLAAIYVEAFATTQHFVDGNKRTALHCALLFLRLNGYRVTADPHLAAQAVLDMASKSINVEQLGVWFATHCDAL
jgi:death-on-curing protein